MSNLGTTVRVLVIGGPANLFAEGLGDNIKVDRIRDDHVSIIRAPDFFNYRAIVFWPTADLSRWRISEEDADRIRRWRDGIDEVPRIWGMDLPQQYRITLPNGRRACVVTTGQAIAHILDRNRGDDPDSYSPEALLQAAARNQLYGVLEAMVNGGTPVIAVAAGEHDRPGNYDWLCWGARMGEEPCRGEIQTASVIGTSDSLLQKVASLLPMRTENFPRSFDRPAIGKFMWRQLVGAAIDEPNLDSLTGHEFLSNWRTASQEVTIESVHKDSAGLSRTLLMNSGVGSLLFIQEFAELPSVLLDAFNEIYAFERYRPQSEQPDACEPFHKPAMGSDREGRLNVIEKYLDEGCSSKKAFMERFTVGSNLGWESIDKWWRNNRKKGPFVERAKVLWERYQQLPENEPKLK